MNKKKIILIAVIVLIAVLVIVGLIAVFGKKEQPESIVKTEISITDNKDNTKPELVVIQPSLKETQNASLSYLARMAAERLGTFTNQSGYLSISDLLPMMTQNMKNWVEETYLPKLKKDYPFNGLLYRVTSVSPVANIISQTENKATLVVENQRTEKYGDNEEKSFFQDLKLEFVKINNNWLIDGAYWQNKR